MREGNRKIKEKFEGLLQGEVLRTPIDEQIVYNQLENNETAIWSLLLASGYLKVLSYQNEEELEYSEKNIYELTFNKKMEVSQMGIFYMECPGCKRYVEASKGSFLLRIIYNSVIIT